MVRVWTLELASIKRRVDSQGKVRGQPIYHAGPTPVGPRCAVQGSSVHRILIYASLLLEAFRM